MVGGGRQRGRSLHGSVMGSAAFCQEVAYSRNGRLHRDIDFTGRSMSKGVVSSPDREGAEKKGPLWGFSQTRKDTYTVLELRTIFIE